MKQEREGDHATVRELATNFVLSFKHSQGAEDTQKLIFQYIHSLHPTWKVTPMSRDEIASLVREPISNYVARAHKHYETPDDPIDVVHEMIDMMQSVFEETYQPAIPLVQLGLEIMLQDIKYLSKDPPVRSNSFFVLYGLEGRATGSAEINQMYKDTLNAIETTAIESEDATNTNWSTLSYIITKVFELHYNPYAVKPSPGKINELTSRIK